MRQKVISYSSHLLSDCYSRIKKLVDWHIYLFIFVLSNSDGNKKPRMRTADDVISRILWDPVVDSSEFVVGYVDRFLGVLERPFDDFTWDTNPCDCDYSAELALPRHRIQYFTYRGHRVWDRHTRTDRVFGSTGQSLAPPFGRVEEVNGKTERLNCTLIYVFILLCSNNVFPFPYFME